MATSSTLDSSGVKGSTGTSDKILAWVFRISSTFLHGCLLRRQTILSSSEPSNAKLDAHNLNDLGIDSGGSSDQASSIHSTILRCDDAFNLPAAVHYNLYFILSHYFFSKVIPLLATCGKPRELNAGQSTNSTLQKNN